MKNILIKNKTANSNSIKNDLLEELNFRNNRIQLGIDTRKDHTVIRHIKAALKGKIYADQLCKTWMICSVQFAGTPYEK